MTGDAFDELDFEYATAFAEKAVRAMLQYRVPPTPNNFHTWFKYSLGVSPDLKRAIDILIGNKRKFDAATNRDLFAMYVRADTGDDSDVNNFSQQLHSVMASAKVYNRIRRTVTGFRLDHLSPTDWTIVTALPGSNAWDCPCSPAAWPKSLTSCRTLSIPANALATASNKELRRCTLLDPTFRKTKSASADWP